MKNKHPDNEQNENRRIFFFLLKLTLTESHIAAQQIRVRTKRNIIKSRSGTGSEANQMAEPRQSQKVKTTRE